MRKLDWFLAAVIAAFLGAAVVAHSAGWRVDSLGFGGPPSSHVSVVVRRLINRCPDMLPDQMR